MKSSEIRDSFESYVRAKYPWVDLELIEAQVVYANKETAALFDLWFLWKVQVEEVDVKDLPTPSYRWAIARSMLELQNSDSSVVYFQTEEDLKRLHTISTIPLREAKVFRYDEEKKKFVFDCELLLTLSLVKGN